MFAGTNTLKRVHTRFNSTFPIPKDTHQHKNVKERPGYSKINISKNKKDEEIKAVNLMNVEKVCYDIIADQDVAKFKVTKSFFPESKYVISPSTKYIKEMIIYNKNELTIEEKSVYKDIRCQPKSNIRQYPGLKPKLETSNFTSETRPRQLGSKQIIEDNVTNSKFYQNLRPLFKLFANTALAFRQKRAKNENLHIGKIYLFSVSDNIPESELKIINNLRWDSSLHENFNKLETAMLGDVINITTAVEKQDAERERKFNVSDPVFRCKKSPNEQNCKEEYNGMISKEVAEKNKNYHISRTNSTNKYKDKETNLTNKTVIKAFSGSDKNDSFIEKQKLKVMIPKLYETIQNAQKNLKTTVPKHVNNITPKISNAIFEIILKLDKVTMKLIDFIFNGKDSIERNFRNIKDKSKRSKKYKNIIFKRKHPTIGIKHKEGEKNKDTNKNHEESHETKGIDSSFHDVRPREIMRNARSSNRNEKSDIAVKNIKTQAFITLVSPESKNYSDTKVINELVNTIAQFKLTPKVKAESPNVQKPKELNVRENEPTISYKSSKPTISRLPKKDHIAWKEIPNMRKVHNLNEVISEHNRDLVEKKINLKTTDCNNDLTPLNVAEVHNDNTHKTALIDNQTTSISKSNASEINEVPAKEVSIDKKQETEVLKSASDIKVINELVNTITQFKLTPEVKAESPNLQKPKELNVRKNEPKISYKSSKPTVSRLPKEDQIAWKEIPNMSKVHNLNEVISEHNRDLVKKKINLKTTDCNNDLTPFHVAEVHNDHTHKTAFIDNQTISISKSNASEINEVPAKEVSLDKKQETEVLKSASTDLYQIPTDSIENNLQVNKDKTMSMEKPSNTNETLLNKAQKSDLVKKYDNSTFNVQETCYNVSTKDPENVAINTDKSHSNVSESKLPSAAINARKFLPRDLKNPKTFKESMNEHENKQSLLKATSKTKPVTLNATKEVIQEVNSVDEPLKWQHIYGSRVLRSQDCYSSDKLDKMYYDIINPKDSPTKQRMLPRVFSFIDNPKNSVECISTSAKAKYFEKQSFVSESPKQKALPRNLAQDLSSNITLNVPLNDKKDMSVSTQNTLNKKHNVVPCKSDEPKTPDEHKNVYTDSQRYIKSGTEYILAKAQPMHESKQSVVKNSKHTPTERTVTQKDISVPTQNALINDVRNIVPPEPEKSNTQDKNQNVYTAASQEFVKLIAKPLPQAKQSAGGDLNVTPTEPTIIREERERITILEGDKDPQIKLEVSSWFHTLGTQLQAEQANTSKIVEYACKDTKVEKDSSNNKKDKKDSSQMSNDDNIPLTVLLHQTRRRSKEILLKKLIQELDAERNAKDDKILKCNKTDPTELGDMKIQNVLILEEQNKPGEQPIYRVTIQKITTSEIKDGQQQEILSKEKFTVTEAGRSNDVNSKISDDDSLSVILKRSKVDLLKSLIQKLDKELLDKLNNTDYTILRTNSESDQETNKDVVLEENDVPSPQSSKINEKPIVPKS